MKVEHKFQTVFKFGLVIFSLCSPLLSYADFSLDSVASIECMDTKPADQVKLKFVTDDEATKNYERFKGQIVYDYFNNSGWLGHDARSGTMSVSNNPSADGGKIILTSTDTQYGTDQLTLVPPSGLKQLPSSGSVEMVGTLVGQVEINNAWVEIS